MAVLSPIQIADRARRVGWPEEDLVMVVANALGESGGNPRARNFNPSTKDDSLGIMQVNLYGDLGPERRRQFGLQSDEDLFDPDTNLRAALEIKKSQGWNAWGVTRSGKYREFLDVARDAVARSRGGATELPAQSGGSDWLSQLLLPKGPEAAGAAQGGAAKSLMAPLAAAALALQGPTLKVSGAPLAGYRLAQGAAQDPLTVAAQAMVSGGPLAMLQPKAVPATTKAPPAGDVNAVLPQQNSMAGLETGQNSGIIITSANDASGEPGSDFVVDGGRRGARFYFPYPATVHSVKRGQGEGVGYGNYVDLTVQLPSGRKADARIAHLDDVAGPLQPGMPIPAGAYIGTQGRTGRTTGPHVSIDWYNPGGSYTPNLAARDEFLNQYLRGLQ